MLTDFLGIGCINDILHDFDDGFLRQDIAWYPMGSPINDKICHLEACTMMIGR
jgi:hypothetical protein